ncbi:MAG TPA: type VII secretion protein EccB [Pseudonocardia sp.]|nr:type VII secretion protein EccB [Pseudonocardia sp.]
MQTKRDQLHAYLFVVGRVKAAVLRANPDGPSIPFRRSTSSTLVGIVVTLVVVGVCVVIGFLFPGRSTSWQDGRSVIVAKETGARFVYVGGLLHPVLNFASARLVLGANAGTVTVSAASLDGTPRGAPIGIPGAPDALPAAAGLLGEPVMACVQPPPPSAAPGSPPRLVVVGGLDVPVRPLDAAVLVQAPGEGVYLAWQGQRLRVPDPAVPLALGITAEARPVPLRWLNTLLPRADLVPPEVPARGGPSAASSAQASLRTGQVLAVESMTGDPRYLLVLPEGLAPIDQLTAALLLGDPRSAEAYGGAVTVREIPGGVVAGAPQTTFEVPESWPDTVPPPARIDADSALCTVHRADAARDEPPALLTVPATDLARAVAVPRDADRDVTAIRPGAALLARSTSVPGVEGGALYLVTDAGVRHALPSPETARSLGYPPEAAVPVPAELLQGIPEGPALDPAAALTPRPSAATASGP